ncbi:hypothetical protein ONE63_005489 [Megalurothrips usitatus]|uniref:RING-type E3 ubiquitin transferase n=1 Tax=Megalurothrips usitatus TaxID=439358 RepID=A0AAV7Y2W1_9NEOP|nr:hypothetical protein ONE63_005489 [Megalurothrips usitatus]
MCREGDRCRYLHEEGSSSSSDEDQTKILTEGKVSKTPKKQTDLDNKIGRCSASSSNSDANRTNVNEEHPTSAPTDEMDLSSTSSSNSTDSQAGVEPVICQYFQQGCCMFGDNCFNKHEVLANTDHSSCKSSDVLQSTSVKSSIIAPSASEKDASAPQVQLAKTSRQHSPPTVLPSSSLEINELKTVESKTRLRVNAPEFIPGKFACAPPADPAPAPDHVNDTKEASSSKTWAQVVNCTAGNGVPSPNVSLCPYAEAGDCPYAENCTYLHGDTCEFCGNSCLHPTNEEQRKSHTDECIKQHEREMELAFAVARSKDKQCGVCFEVVVDKNPASEQRFGILPNCNHCFCLACIRKWRQAKQFENKIIRACPECRVTSDFVCPSMYWVDTKEEKDKLIMAYKDALSNKQCKYFKQGRGKCPFGNKCFYLHAYPDGTKVDTGPPIRRHRQNADGETDVLQLFLWDFLDERDNRWLYSLDDLDLVAFLSGSDDSDASEIDYF